jgi:vitamin B12 transporter
MRRLLAFAAGLLGGAVPAVAQLPPSVPPPFAAEITVTASAAEEPAGAVPVAVDVADRATIEARQADEAIDLLRTFAGVEIVRTGSPGKAASLFLRGTNSSHTLVLWNGVALNDPFAGGFDWSTLSTDGVERLELVRGPFSALYGSSAVGGVVQLVTRAPAGNALRARLEAGSHELLRAGLAAARPLGSSGRSGLDLAGHWRRGEGEVDNDFYDGDELAAGGRFALSPGARLGARLRRVESEIGLPYDFLGAPSPRRRQRLEALSVALPFDWSGSALRLESQVAATRTELALADPDDPFAASAADAERREARVLLAGSVARGIELAGGAEWRRDEVDSSSAFGPGLAGERQRIAAVFAQASLSRGALRLDAGARRDDSDAFGGETSARAALAWRLAERWRLRAGYGESFRAPSLADLYFPGFANPALEPERGASWELALERSTRALTAGVALFGNDLDNLIEFDFATFRPENLGRARVRGVEATAGYRSPSGLAAARLAATWLDAEDRATGRDLLRRPDLSASLAWTLRPERWTLGGVLRHVGERTDFGDLALDPYTTLDLLASWRLRDGVEPTLRVENAADASYEEAAGFPAPGRAWIVGCALRFF